LTRFPHSKRPEQTALAKLEANDYSLFPNPYSLFLRSIRTIALSTPKVLRE
jgi:hypothetical protein